MTLSSINVRLWSSRSPVAIAAGVFLLASAAFLTRAGVQIGLSAPPGLGDQPEYDLLAMELAAGNGFRFDYDNTAWRGPYEAANADGAYDPILNRHGAAPTTYRPPLFPAVTAGLYSVFGRSFVAVRVFNCLAMAAAGALAAWLVARRLGPLPGLLCGVLFAVVEHRARYHAGLVLTESLASLLAMLLVLLLVWLARSGGIRAAAFAGLIMGLGILNRPLVALWLPVIVPMVWWIATSGRLRTTTTYALVTLLVIAPWTVRNSLLLGRFSPLGTHGQQNLSAAYSDEAFEHRGVWFNLDSVGFFPRSINNTRPGLERELLRADLSQAAALEWIKQNPLKIPALAAMRVGQLWYPRMHWDALILGLAAFGAFVWPAAADRRVLVGLLLANTLAVAVTWSVAGRFLVPVLPILHSFAACGLWAMILAALDKRTELRAWLERPE